MDGKGTIGVRREKEPRRSGLWTAAMAASHSGRHGGQYVSVRGAGKAGDVTVKSVKPGDAETFQWVDLQRGETLLLSLATHRYIVSPRTSGQ